MEYGSVIAQSLGSAAANALSLPSGDSCFRGLTGGFGAAPEENRGAAVRVFDR
jgi:hypothetical protein